MNDSSNDVFTLSQYPETDQPPSNMKDNEILESTKVIPASNVNCGDVIKDIYISVDNRFSEVSNEMVLDTKMKFDNKSKSLSESSAQLYIKKQSNNSYEYESPKNDNPPLMLKDTEILEPIVVIPASNVNCEDVNKEAHNQFLADSNEQIKDSIDSKMEFDNIQEDTNTFHYSRINWLATPNLLCKADKIYKNNQNNFLRGCHWSPDGTCILSNSDDNVLRIFELPKEAYDKEMIRNENLNIEMSPVLQMRDLDMIYDVCWYPYMNSNNPDTCFFASTSKKNAVRLWDAYTGKERTRFLPRDHMDEPVSAQSIAFGKDGVKLYCGFDKNIRVYDITKLGSNPERRPRLGNKSDLRGIISCITTSQVNIGMYACGSYSKDAAVFHENTRGEILEFLRADDRIGGITHIEFSPVDMNCIVTGSRVDDALHVWDLRNPGSPLYATAKRNVKTNQRIYFSFDPTGNYIMSGNHDGKVSVFSINAGHIVIDDECILPKISHWSAHEDVCNGLALHPYLPLLATGSGQRRIVPPWRRKGMLDSVVDNFGDDSDDWSTDEENDLMFGVDENQLKIWAFPVMNKNNF